MHDKLGGGGVSHGVRARSLSAPWDSIHRQTCLLFPTYLVLDITGVPSDAECAMLITGPSGESWIQVLAKELVPRDLFGLTLLTRCQTNPRAIMNFEGMFVYPFGNCT